MLTRKPAGIGRWLMAGVLAVLIAYIVTIFPRFRARSEWEQTVAALQRLPRDRVSLAAKTYARERNVTNGFVALRELVSNGYLGQGEVGSLLSRDAGVILSNSDMYPPTTWIRMPAANGSEIVMLSDGSVVGFTSVHSPQPRDSERPASLRSP